MVDSAKEIEIFILADPLNIKYAQKLHNFNDNEYVSFADILIYSGFALQEIG